MAEHSLTQGNNEDQTIEGVDREGAELSARMCLCV